MAYTGKFIDRSPNLRAAGSSTYRSGEAVASCLVHEVFEEEGKPFVCKTGPLEYKLPPVRTNIYKGFYTDVRDCMQPNANESFCDIYTHEFKDTVYDSYWKKPLGRVADPVPNLPAGMKPLEICFGKPTQKDIDAGKLINPKQLYVDVMEESKVGSHMYKKTHNDFDPGEQVSRDYVAPFNPKLMWGKETPCDPLGGCMKKVMETDSNDKIMVSKILAHYLKRTKDLVGKVSAPNNNIACVPEGHAFGKLNKRELFGVGELLKDCQPNLDKIDYLEEMSYINALREQIVKKQPPFPHRELLDAFHRIDISNSGCLPLEEAYKVLTGFRVLPDKSLFESLLKRLKIISADGKFVTYEKMAGILNVNIEFPNLSKVEDVPREFLNFQTTNQLSEKYHYTDKFSASKDVPRAGVPSTSHVDMKGIVSPSIFSNYGIEPKDFFVSRTPDFIRSLLKNTGCEMSNELFCKMWDLAKDKNGCVSVQAFLNAMKNIK